MSRPSSLEIEYYHGWHEGALVGEYDRRNSQLSMSTYRILEMLDNVHGYRDSEQAHLGMVKHFPPGLKRAASARKLRAWSLGWLRGYRKEVLND